MKARGYRRSVVAVVGLAALFTAAPANAAVTLGSTLATEPTSNKSCTGGGSDRGCTLVPDLLPGRDLVAPFDGVIVRWRVRLGDGTEAQTVRIRVVRQAGADTFTAISSGQLESVPAGAGTYEFPAQLAIRSGDQVAIESENGATLVLGVIDPGALFFFYGPPPPAEGGTTGPPTFTPAEELTFNVDIEPDCDADGFGDETQDPSIASCHPRTLTLDANKNKVKKGKKVTLTGQIAETRQTGACAANQPLELQRKKPKKSEFKTVEQLQTDAAGAFSTKEKVKKTFEYRVQAAETATCAGQTSNTERVKAKKPK
jgi:hypothetical protein